MQKFPQGLGLLNLLGDIYSSNCISYATSAEEPFSCMYIYNNNWEHLLNVYTALSTLLKVSYIYVTNEKSITLC